LSYADFVRLIFDESDFYDAAPDVLLGEWRQFHVRIIAVLHAIWVCVHDVLCNDAPEGYVPEEMDEEYSISTKDILSYCWRALKEARCVIWGCL
jgi:hypothetical protein